MSRSSGLQGRHTSDGSRRNRTWRLLARRSGYETTENYKHWLHVDSLVVPEVGNTNSAPWQDYDTKIIPSSNGFYP